MKQIYKILSINLLLVTASFSQNQDKVQSRIEGTDRAQGNSINAQINGNNSENNNDASSSDTGAQRPISLNDDEISAFFGYDSRYYYRSNPLFVNGDISEEVESDMWTNTFFTGISSVIEKDDSAYTPFLTASYTVNDYLEDDLGAFNYNATNITTGLFSYYGGQNTYFVKIAYNMDRSTENDTEDFSEFFSQIGLISSFQVLNKLNINTTVGIGQHSSTIDDVSGTRPEDLMDNLEINC